MCHSMCQPIPAAIPLTAEQLAVLLPSPAPPGQWAQILLAFRGSPITPLATQKLETVLQSLLRNLGRTALEQTINSLEADALEQVPEAFGRVGGDRYRRRREVSAGGRFHIWPDAAVAWLYEPRTPGERCLFPLEHLLGLVAGQATPALASRVGRLAAQYEQRSVLRLLKEDNAPRWSHALLARSPLRVAAIVSG